MSDSTEPVPRPRTSPSGLGWMVLAAITLSVAVTSWTVVSQFLPGSRGLGGIWEQLLTESFWPTLTEETATFLALGGIGGLILGQSVLGWAAPELPEVGTLCSAGNAAATAGAALGTLVASVGFQDRLAVDAGLVVAVLLTGVAALMVRAILRSAAENRQAERRRALLLETDPESILDPDAEARYRSTD